MSKLPKLATAVILVILISSSIFTNGALAAKYFEKASPAKTQNSAIRQSVNQNKAQQAQNGILQQDNWDFLDSPQPMSTRYDTFSWFSDNKYKLVIGLNNQNLQTLNTLTSLIGKFGGKVTSTVQTKTQPIAVSFDVPTTNASELSRTAKTQGLARYVEPNMEYTADFAPNDADYYLQYGPQIIQADYAWNTTTGNKTNVLVAVIDTGIQYTHPELTPNYVPLGYDWVNNDNDPLDDHGHGTHCAGIIAAALNNSIGIAGIAQVRVMAEKGLDYQGSGTEAALANAIIHAADQGANILSNSWGGTGDSQLIHDAIRYAYNKGCLIIAAAGNTGSSTKSYPAAYDEVIAVTATDQNDNIAYFSSYGNWVELAAPGVSIYSTYPADSYTFMSGTSMACPHVAGAAALALSLYPNKSRDWIRLWLRYTADDIGEPGFDNYFGHGRINARKIVETTPPQHDLILSSLQTPPYLEPNSTGTLKAIALNFGEAQETNMTVQLFTNETLTNSATISTIAAGETFAATLSWTPTIEGSYNVTVRIIPLTNEINTENNVLEKKISVGFPLKAFVLQSAGTSYTEIIDNWQVLNTEWETFGNKLIFIDYTTLNKDDITFQDLVNSKADILIISCAYDPSSGWEFTDSEIEAIKQYTYEGHGLIATAGTFYYAVPNNNKLAPLFGLKDTIYFGSTGTDLVNVQNVSHPLFKNVPNPLVLPQTGTALPSDGVWDQDELAGGEYLGLGEFRESAVVTLRGLAYISFWPEVLPAYYHHNLQLLYNAITWSRYQVPEHELVVSLQAPSYLTPGETTLLNASVSNYGASNETNVELRLFINNALVEDVAIPELLNGTTYSIDHLFNPIANGFYNVTAFAPPVPGETTESNNVGTTFITVTAPIINPIEGQYANYTLKIYSPSGTTTSSGHMNMTYAHYVEPYIINVTMWQDQSGNSNFSSSSWTTVNTLNRYVEAGVWAGLWFPGWIETTVSIGSVINLMDSQAQINGSKIVLTGSRAIDCWEIPLTMYGYPYIFRYDKVSGLWISMESRNPYTNEVMEFVLDETNVPIGTQYLHDLSIRLDAPYHLQPSETALLNVTVVNVGLSDEFSVLFAIWANETSIWNYSIPELANGTSFKTMIQWIPPEVGTYNLSAFVLPVTGENVTADNTATQMVHVSYTDVALISDYSDLSPVGSLLDSMGISYDIFSNNQFYHYTEDSNLLLNYRAIVFDKHSRLITTKEHDALAAYISAGGNLLVTGYDSLAYPSDSLLADIVRSSSVGDDQYQSDLIVVADDSPIMKGLYGNFSAGYHISGLFSNCDLANADTTRNALTVAKLNDGNDKIISNENLPGKVVYWNGEGAYDWTGGSIASLMFKNLMNWFTLQYNHEIVVSFHSPDFIQPHDSLRLNATIRNLGLSDEHNVSLQLFVNGTLIEDLDIPLIRSREIYTTPMITWPSTNLGVYNVTAYSSPIPDEAIAGNNIYSKMVLVRFAPKVLAYVQYSDYTHGYPNVLKAIATTFGSDFVLTELWDYQQLGSMISSNDVLLIPEQSYAGLSTMTIIGSALSSALSDFLERGGVIVVCDYLAGTYGVLTGSGLMSISGVNYRTWYMLKTVDATDPLAVGLESQFVGPDGTSSFITGEGNVVANDGTYPVVIHKRVGAGHIVLLGFDFSLTNGNTEKLLGNSLTLVPNITVTTNPSSGTAGTQTTINGGNATSSGSISVFWDNVFLDTVKANGSGEYTYLLAVSQDALPGRHTVMTVDSTTGHIGLAPFIVFELTADSSRGSVGTRININGRGFTPNSEATVNFNEFLIGHVMVGSDGEFSLSFNVPSFSTIGVQHVKVLDVAFQAQILFDVIDDSPLEVNLDVGAMYFAGEIAEFYAQTVFKGNVISASVTSAVLHKPDGTTEVLTVEQVATGLYKLSYTVPAETGTYALVIQANLGTDTIDSNGTSLKTFLVSGTLALMNSQILDIEGGVATIQADVGLVKMNLTAMNASLGNIFVKVLEIDGEIATIQTTIGTINGTITNVNSNVASIQVQGLGDIKADISNLRDALMMPQYAILILVLISAAGAIVSIVLLRRMRASTMRKKPDVEPLTSNRPAA